MASRKRQQTGSMTLLEKAVGYKGFEPIIHGIGNEHYELAVAWVMGQVTNSQVAEALGLRKTNGVGLSKGSNLLAVYRMAAYLREAIKRDVLKVETN